MLLFRPRLLAADGRGVYAYDYHDHSLKAFGPDGALRWRFGRQGGGPGEFMMPFDMEVGADATLWILDPAGRRVTLVSTGGTFLRVVPLDAEGVTRLVPRPDGAIVVSTGLNSFWRQVDNRGRITAEGEIPFRGLSEVDPRLRQPLAAGRLGAARWAVTFIYGDRFAAYEGDRLRCRGWLVEGAPFPQRLGGDVPIWAAAIVAGDTTAFVLARGRTKNELRLIDAYSMADCRYRYTYLLPERIHAMAYAAGVFYVEVEDPAPALLGLVPVLN